MKKLLISALAGIALLSGCHKAADVVSQQMSEAADNFEINRRIVFYNGITGGYMLTIEGLCSKDNSSTDRKLAIVCKVGPNAYKKHFLGLSDNVTYFIEQVEQAKASEYHYRVIFNPSAIIPSLEIK